MNKDEKWVFFWKNGKLLKFNPDYKHKENKPKEVKNDNDFKVSDITSGFLEKATPNKGKMEFAPDYDYDGHKDEIETAYWIVRKFGGDVYLNEEDNSNEHKGISNPDYVWNGKWWDLKGVKTLNAISKRLQDGIEQINNNPNYIAGGVILDITGSMVEKYDVFKTIKNRLYFSAKSEMTVIVKKADDVFIVIEYKKK